MIPKQGISRTQGDFAGICDRIPFIGLGIDGNEILPYEKMIAFSLKLNSFDILCRRERFVSLQLNQRRIRVVRFAVYSQKLKKLDRTV